MKIGILKCGQSPETLREEFTTLLAGHDPYRTGVSALPGWFQFIGDYKLLVYGGLLFLMMRFAPGGLAGIVESLRKRKPKAKPNTQAAAAAKGAQP